MARSETHCGHGKSYDVPCLECELVWHEAMLKSAEADVEHHRQKIEILTAIRDALAPGRPTATERRRREYMRA